MLFLNIIKLVEHSKEYLCKKCPYDGFTIMESLVILYLSQESNEMAFYKIREDFKGWGVSTEDIVIMRTLTKDVEFVNPVGRHEFDGSGKAHRELLHLIDYSLDYETFKRKLRNCVFVN